MPRFLSTQAARQFYDRFGARQDSQGFYEDAALDRLVAEGRFETASNVFEFGCGTGRLAHRLLNEALPATARYEACDISETMVALAKQRTAPFGDRVKIVRSAGDCEIPAQNAPYDRIVSTYVLDLLPPGNVTCVLDKAAGALRPGGLMCLVSLTWGTSTLPALTSRLWALIHRLRPQLVGGCRPIRLRPLLVPEVWRVIFDGQVAPWSVASEILIAERI